MKFRPIISRTDFICPSCLKFNASFKPNRPRNTMYRMYNWGSENCKDFKELGRFDAIAPLTPVRNLGVAQPLDIAAQLFGLVARIAQTIHGGAQFGLGLGLLTADFRLALLEIRKR